MPDLENPPLYLQRLGYTAFLDRKLISALSYKTSGLLSRDSFKLNPSAGLAVSWTIDGEMIIKNTVGEYYIVSSNSSYSLVLPAAPVPRWDQVIIRVYDSYTDNSITSDKAQIEIIQGTPDAANSSTNRVGAAVLPPNSLRLYDILVNGSTCSFFDRRTYCNPGQWNGKTDTTGNLGPRYLCENLIYGSALPINKSMVSSGLAARIWIEEDISTYRIWWSYYNSGAGFGGKYCWSLYESSGARLATSNWLSIDTSSATLVTDGAFLTPVIDIPPGNYWILFQLDGSGAADNNVSVTPGRVLPYFDAGPGTIRSDPSNATLILTGTGSTIPFHLQSWSNSGSPTAIQIPNFAFDMS